jgi:hypothetical protein
MNEHLKNVHEHNGMNAQDFDLLPTVAAAKTGAKGSYEPIKVIGVRTPDNFRTESVFEARVGLLKSCFFFEGEEEALLEGAVWWDGKAKENPFFAEVLTMLTEARDMCNRAGSTLVRQHAVRDASNEIHAKVFLPVQERAARHYAKSVAHFLYFCSKMEWAGQPLHDMSAVSMMKSVLFEKHTGIAQTFITR